MPYRKRKKRRKKITRKDITFFLMMCFIAAAAGAILNLIHGHGNDVRGFFTESIVREYQYRTGKRNLDPITRRRIASAIEASSRDN